MVCRPIKNPITKNSLSAIIILFFLSVFGMSLQVGTSLDGTRTCGRIQYFHISKNKKRVIVAASDKLIVWENDFWRDIMWPTRVDTPTRVSCFSPCGIYIITMPCIHGPIIIYRVIDKDNTVLGLLKYVKTIHSCRILTTTVCMVLLPNQRTLISGQTDGLLIFSEFDGNILSPYVDPYIYPYRFVDAHKAGVTALCVTPDGQHIISASYDNSIAVTCIQNHTIIKRIHGLSWSVMGVCMTPCGQYIVCAEIFCIRMLRFDTGKTVCYIKDKGKVWAVGVTPNNQFLMCGRYNGSNNTIENPLLTMQRRLWARSLYTTSITGAFNVNKKLKELKGFFDVYPGLLKQIGTKMLLYYTVN